MFKVSDKVVCIRTPQGTDSITGKIGNFIDSGADVVKDKVYVVSKIITYPDWPVGMFGLAFVGSTCFCGFTGREVGLGPVNFRKLEEIQKENRLKSFQTKTLTKSN
jgi:hypothetical protein